MATNIDINITDLSGHTFTIKLNWDIGAMKDSISIYYDNKFKNDFLLENNLTDGYLNNLDKYFKSDYYKKAKYYIPENIQLIYKGKMLKLVDIDDEYSEDDFKKDNNMNVIICKNDENNKNDDDDNDSNISFISD